MSKDASQLLAKLVLVPSRSVTMEELDRYSVRIKYHSIYGENHIYDSRSHTEEPQGRAARILESAKQSLAAF